MKLVLFVAVEGVLLNDKVQYKQASGIFLKAPAKLQKQDECVPVNIWRVVSFHSSKNHTGCRLKSLKKRREEAGENKHGNMGPLLNYC